MKFVDLVPPLELCKLIPKGEFEDSALVWIAALKLWLKLKGIEA